MKKVAAPKGRKARKEVRMQRDYSKFEYDKSTCRAIALTFLGSSVVMTVLEAIFRW